MKGLGLGQRAFAGLSWLCLVEVALLVAAAPLLLFPSRWSPAGVGLLVIGPLLRLVSQGRLTAPTPVDWPILGLLAMLPVGLLASADLSMGLPKFYGLVLEIAAFYVVVNYMGGSPSIRLAAYAVIALGVGLALLGPLATDWTLKRRGFFDPLYAQMPRLPVAFVSSQGTPLQGIHPNELAGSLTMILPLAAALILFRRPGRLLLTTMPCVLVLGGAIILSASRSALMGAMIALLFLIVLRFPRLGLVTLSVIGAGVVAGWFMGGDRFFMGFLTLDTPIGAGTWADRIRLWSQSTHMLQDLPFTGVGLNTFPIVADSPFPLTSIGPTGRLPHAHNIFLQTGLDLGVAGLASFLLLLFLWFWTTAKTLRDSLGLERALLVGCMGGVVAYLGYGLTDAITLGAKPLIILWMLLGLGLAVCKNALEEPGSLRFPTARRAITSMVVAAVGLILFVVDGIAAIQQLHASGLDIGLALAGAFGICLFALGLRWLAPVPCTPSVKTEQEGLGVGGHGRLKSPAR